MDHWFKVCALEDIPRLGTRVVMCRHVGDIALFRSAADDVFALSDRDLARRFAVRVEDGGSVQLLISNL